MRKATRKEEIAAIEFGLSASSTPAILERMILSYCTSRKIIPVEITNFCKNYSKEILPWQWQELLITLQLGWRRYFYICGHKDSIFVRIQVHQLKSTGGCVCCLYWRGIISGFLFAIILFSLFNLGKFLL